jgi:pSer/pThr/pTyr-binding forkhead associated (FHA) protein
MLVAATSGKEYRITKPITVIGRASNCDIVLRSAEVSKRHCQLVLGSDHLVVEDLGSSNGTQINGRVIQRSLLRDGDRLGVGQHTLIARLQKQEDTFLR